MTDKAPDLPLADCPNCYYKQLVKYRTDGAHCYMFSTGPSKYCAQFKPIDREDKQNDGR